MMKTKKLPLNFFRPIRVFLLISLILLNLTIVNAAENRASTHISFGQYASSDGDDTVVGSRISISFINPISDVLSYYLKASTGSASGKHTNSDNSETEITSSHTNAGSGLQLNFDLTDNDKFILFLGSGLLLQSYQYDYDYPDSETGKTSGIGYGYTAYTGIKFRAARNFIIIPSYNYEQVIIKSEAGKQRTTTTAGASLALAIAF